MFASSTLASRFGGHGGSSRIELPPTSSGALVDDAISLPTTSHARPPVQGVAGPSRSPQMGRSNYGNAIPRIVASGYSPNTQASYDSDRSPVSFSGRFASPLLRADNTELSADYRTRGAPLSSQSPRRAAASLAPESPSPSQPHTGEWEQYSVSEHEVRTTRLPYEMDTASSIDSDKEGSPPPPAVPVKPYPPKLTDAPPITPFALTFGLSEKSPESTRTVRDRMSHARHHNGLKADVDPSVSLAPTVSMPSNMNSVNSTLSISSINGIEWASLNSRDSACSMSSSAGEDGAVLANANAVNLQRASPRQVGEQSKSTLRAQATKQPGVDKGVGVRMRRKSRESEVRSSKSKRASTRDVSATQMAASSKQNQSMTKGESETSQQSSRSLQTSSGSQKVVQGTEKSSESQPGSALQEVAKVPAVTVSQGLEVPGGASRAKGTRNTRGLQITTAMAATTAAASKRADGVDTAPTDIALHSPWAEQNFSEDLLPTSGSNQILESSGFSSRRRHDRRGANDNFANEWAISDASASIHDESSVSFDAATSMYAGKNFITPLTPSSPSVKSAPGLFTDGKSGNNSMVEQQCSVKDTLLRQLMASVALVDTQARLQFSSLEEVEQCKRDIIRLEQRASDLQLKLKVHLRVRDAANKLRRAALRGGAQLPSPRSAGALSEHSLSPQSAHRRQGSSASSIIANSAAGDVQKTEADAVAATQQVDAITRELFAIRNAVAEHRERLLQHHASVLADRVEALEEQSSSSSRLTQDSTIATSEDEDDDAARKPPHVLRIPASSEVSQELQKLRAAVARHEEEQSQLKNRHADELSKVRQEASHDIERLTSEHQLALSKQKEALNDKLLGAERNFKAENLRLESLTNELNQHKQLLASEQARSSAASEESQRKVDLLKAAEEKCNTLQAELRNSHVEREAEQAFLQETQSLFGAFESRLNTVESRLREENDRCARMLGKVEGREEMDDLLSRIKMGQNHPANASKKRTAGQDIAELMDSLSTHLNDLEDELRRAESTRRRGLSRHSDDSIGQRHSQSEDPAVRELSLNLLQAQREVAEWRGQAENASRQLKALERQSAISLVSSPNLGTRRYSSRLSVYSGGGRQSQYLSDASARRPQSRIVSSRSRTAAELDARIVFLEKRNTALEEELSTASHVRMSMRASNKGQKDDPAFSELAHELLRILPVLEADLTDDLHELQEALENMPMDAHVVSKDISSQQLCMFVMDRTRSLLQASRGLAGKALTLEMRNCDLEDEVYSSETKVEELESAMETLRSSQSANVQTAEAAKARERQVEKIVAELREKIESLTSANVSPEGALTAKQLSRQSTSTTATGTMTKSGSFGRQLNLRRSPQRTMNLTLTPSPSKISFATSGTSTPAATSTTSHVLWSATANPPSPARWPSSLRSKNSTVEAQSAPRSMTLGMNSIQLTQRVRELEQKLLRSKASASETGAALPSTERSALIQQLDEANARLESNEREIEDLRNIESRQRVALLEEMTSLTSDLSAARAELRRYKAHSPMETSL